MASQIENKVRAVSKSIVDATLISLVRYVKANADSSRATMVLDEVYRKTALSSADYAVNKMSKSMIFRKREDLWDFVLERCEVKGLVLEFGVSEGKSINYIAKAINQKIYGFDSFEGLQEDWAGSHLKKGAFSRQGSLPRVASNVELIKGWFNRTLDIFLSENEGLVRFLHIDGDTYEAAKVVLDQISPRLTQGSMIVFDEYFGYPGWKDGEYKALQEFVASKDVQYEYIAYSENSVAIKII